MRVIKPSTIRGWQRAHATGAKSLERWLKLTKRNAWHDLADVRRSFRDTDPVRTSSGRVVHVFNISGNRFRLIAAIHFNRQRVYALRLLTHAEYSKNGWKDEL